MTHADFMAVLPLVILAGAAILILLAIAFIGKRHEAAFIVCLAGLASALGSLGLAWPTAPRMVANLLAMDRFALFTAGLIISATIVTAAVSHAYLKRREDERGEYYFLLTLSALGGCLLASSAGFVSFFLGLELLSMPLFTLIAYKHERDAGARAALMYLVLTGVSSAFLLFGMALAYLDQGSQELARLARALSGGEASVLLRAGFGMMVVGIGFKLAVVPFHLWTPDIYDGAPAPVAGFIATVSKGAMAVLLVRIFAPAGVGAAGAFAWIFALISGLSMFAGNLLALREDNLKRMLAYSSIAHLGYLLIAFVAGGPQAAGITAFYLLVYFVSSLGAFAVVTAVSVGDKDADRVEDYRAMAARRPWLAAVMTASLLSLAGLPLTAGFMGKFVLFAAGEGAWLWVLAVLLAINSTISLFYYLRVVSVMYRAEPAEASGGGADRREPGIPLLTGMALAVTLLAIAALGLYPEPVLKFLQSIAVV